MAYNKEIIKSFWDKVKKEDSLKCWLWAAGQSWDGYGQFRSKRAHRVSYELKYGSIPGDYHILHSCGNKLCVNPYHLYLGTEKQNREDQSVHLEQRICYNL